MRCWHRAAWVGPLAGQGTRSEICTVNKPLSSRCFHTLSALSAKLSFSQLNPQLGGWMKRFVDCVHIPCNQGSYNEWNLKDLGLRWPMTSKRKFAHKLYQASKHNHRLLQIEVSCQYILQHHSLLPVTKVPTTIETQNWGLRLGWRWPNHFKKKIFTQIIPSFKTQSPETIVLCR